MTSHPIQSEDVLVVGGGDTAAQFNRVTLSYRQAQFSRLK